MAQEEARTLQHDHIGSEHILLGLLREREGLAAQVLGSLDVTLERVRAHLVRIVGTGEGPAPDAIPFTPRAKKILELALREALSLEHNYIDTEHILLGLVRDTEGVAMRILLDFDADSAKIRDEVLRMLPRRPGPRRVVGGSGRAVVSGVPWLHGLDRILDPLAGEIRSVLGRDPDAGDLLLALASVPGTVPARLFRELGVDLDALSGMIARTRAQVAGETVKPSADDVLREIRRRLGLPGLDNPAPPEPS